MIGIFYSLPSSRDEPAGKTSRWPPATAEIVWDLYNALRDGLAAHREYERLKSTGMRHDPALRASLNVPFVDTRNGQRQESSSLAQPQIVPVKSALVIGVIAAWMERRRQRKVLAELDDRLLRD